MAMKILDYMEYFERPVRVKLSDGRIVDGVLTGIENSFETDSGKDEIELDVGAYYEGIEISDIRSIEVLN